MYVTATTTEGEITLTAAQYRLLDTLNRAGADNFLASMLAVNIGASERTVKYANKVLAQEGLINLTRTRLKKGQQGSNHYSVTGLGREFLLEAQMQHPEEVVGAGADVTITKTSNGTKDVSVFASDGTEFPNTPLGRRSLAKYEAA